MKYYVIVGVLIIALAAVIGISIAAQKPDATAQQQSAAKPVANPPATPTTQKPQASGQQAPDAKPAVSSKLTIAIPGANATKKDNDVYYENVSKQAVAATKVTFTSCLPDVLVAKFAKSAALTFINADAQPITVYYKKDTSVVVPGKSQKEVRMDEAGIYAYSCQPGPSSAVGLLMVTSE